MIRTSSTVGVLAAALLAAQRTFENVVKDADNPYFKSKYADLPGVMGEVKPKLNANGITVMQFPAEAPEGHLGLVTRLQHEGGEWMEATAVVPLPKADPQGFGSAVTYTRRYALMSALGLVTEDDDDGNAGSNTGRGPAGGAKQPPKAPGGGIFGGKPAAVSSGGEKKAEAGKAPEKKKGGLFPTPAAKRTGTLEPAAPKGGGGDAGEDGQGEE